MPFLLELFFCFLDVADFLWTFFLAEILEVSNLGSGLRKLLFSSSVEEVLQVDSDTKVWTDLLSVFFRNLLSSPATLISNFCFSFLNLFSKFFTCLLATFFSSNNSLELSLRFLMVSLELSNLYCK